MPNRNIDIGIMGGRLSKQNDGLIQSFPKNNWREEFEIATNIGFNSIEWVFDLHKNPILDDDGIREIGTLLKKFDVKITSVCCDFFMERGLINVSSQELEKNLKILKILIEKSHKLGIKFLEIPLLYSSSLKNENDRNQIVFNLQKVLPLAEKNEMKITLETDLPPLQFKQLLEDFDHPSIAANYDTGNSASLGFNPQEELNAFGRWVKNIHIKDRILHGSTVPLGQGDTNFDLFFSILAKIGYNGELIIQGARLDEKETPETTCGKYLKFVKQYVDKYL